MRHDLEGEDAGPDRIRERLRHGGGLAQAPWRAQQQLKPARQQLALLAQDCNTQLRRNHQLMPLKQALQGSGEISNSFLDDYRKSCLEGNTSLNNVGV